MHTSKGRNPIEVESLPIEIMEYRSVILLVALFDIHSLSCECRINVFMRVTLNCMQDLIALL